MEDSGNSSMRGTFDNCTRNYSCQNTGTEPWDYSAYYFVSLDLVIGLLILILLVGLIGNSIVVIVITLERKMQTFTNWLILNLAVADLSVAILCIPLELPLELSKKWIYGSIFCRIFYPIESATIYGSVFTLVVLSCSRYWAILHPYGIQPTTYGAKISICAIWVSSILLVTPYMMGLKYDPKTGQCKEVWSAIHRRIYTTVTFTLQYVVPLTIIIVAYTFIIYEITLKKNPSASLYEDKIRNQESKKLIKLLLIITTTFALCVLPYHIIAIWSEFGNANDFKYIEDVSIGSYILLYLNSALNPVIYNVFSSSFREALGGWYRRIWTKMCTSDDQYRRKTDRSSTNTTMTSFNGDNISLSIKSPFKKKNYTQKNSVIVEVIDENEGLVNTKMNC